MAFGWSMAIAIATAGELLAQLLGNNWSSWFGFQAAINAKRFSFTLVTALGGLTLLPGAALGALLLAGWVLLAVAARARRDWALPAMTVVYVLDTALVFVRASLTDATLLSFFGFLSFSLRLFAVGSWLSAWSVEERLRRLGFAVFPHRSPKAASER